MQTAKHLTTKNLILDTAVKIASREGIEGLTIGELAKAVGMSKSGLFAHFGGRDQLQLDVLKLATEKFIDLVMRPAFKAERGEPRVKAMFKNWLDHLNNESELPGGSILIAASIELDDRPGALRDFAQKAQQDLIANIEKAAQISVEEDHFRADLDVEQFAWSMYSFVLGYHHFKRFLDDPKAELHVKRSFNGLLAISRSVERTRERVSKRESEHTLKKVAIAKSSSRKQKKNKKKI